MTKIKTSLISLAAVLVTSVSASAADLYAPAPVASWTGFYIGAGIGGQFAIGDASAEADWVQALPSFAVEVDQYPDAAGNVGAESFFGTVGAGFDYQMNDRLVVGAMGDYSFGKKKSAGVYGDSNTIVEVPNEGDFYGRSEVSAEFSVSDSWFVGGRLGYLATPDVMLYGLVGYTQAKISASWYSEAFENAFIEGYGDTWANRTSWRGGLTLGGGVESMLSENISARLEYRYTNLSSINFDSVDNIGGTDDEGYDLDYGNGSYDPNLHSIRLTVSYRF